MRRVDDSPEYHIVRTRKENKDKVLEFTGYHIYKNNEPFLTGKLSKPQATAIANLLNHL